MKDGCYVLLFFWQFIWLQQGLFNSLLQWVNFSVLFFRITFKIRTSTPKLHHSWELYLYPSSIISFTKSTSHPHGPENPVMLSGVQTDAGGQDLVVAMISRSAFQCSRIPGGNFKRSCSGVLDDGSGFRWNLWKGGFAGVWEPRSFLQALHVFIGSSTLTKHVRHSHPLYATHAPTHALWTHGKTHLGSMTLYTFAGVIKFPFKKCKCMVILGDLPCTSVLFGLVIQ